jgi:hypothetical protein
MPAANDRAGGKSMASQSSRAFAAFALSTALAACIGDQVPLGGGGAGGASHDGGATSECGGGSSGGQADAASPCASNADCSPQQVCGFRENATNACSGLGQCFTPEQVVCNSVLLGCACDGTDVNMVCNGLPDGYATKPVAHTGACTDASGGADAGGPCTTSTECPPQYLCGFRWLVPNACSGEQGECFLPSGATCQSFFPGCACDDTLVNLACNGLPGGYATKPVAHTGVCTDGSSGD